MTTSLIEARVDLACGQQKMSGLGQNYRSLIRDALERNSDHLDFLVACLEHEVSQKQEQRQLTI